MAGPPRIIRHQPEPDTPRVYTHVTWTLEIAEGIRTSR